MRVGILGGGQLARMLAQAGLDLGVGCVFVDPAADACAGAVARHLLGAWDDPAMLARLAADCDVVTFEFENVPASALEALAGRVPVRPSARCLAVSSDRLLEKSLFRELGIATAAFVAVDGAMELAPAVAQVGYPCLLKTRREGYDGKGQVFLSGPGDLDAAALLAAAAPCILERRVDFRREVSLVAVRNAAGTLHCYPLTENRHREGILRHSVARPGDPLQAEAESVMARLAGHLDYVGVLTVEFFDVGGTLTANEMAPRVHNSGHWTIEGAAVSQFENHLRAVLDLPLGGTGMLYPAQMVNFIGAMPSVADALALPGVRLHDYGKATRPGRKLGHATLLGEQPDVLEALLALDGAG